jgi:sugar lactone lactonase YvrE
VTRATSFKRFFRTKTPPIRLISNPMKYSSVCVALFTVLSTTSLFAQSLEKTWESEATLKVPESVLFDGARKVLYVTNIDGEPWGKDGKGSIGKVGLDGKVQVVDWVSGLQAPKGMALRGSELFVGDMDEVVVIDVDQAKIARRIKVAGAKGLNDVTVDPKGVLFVSDSQDKKVYRIEKDTPAVWIEKLKGPNGVLWHSGSLYLVDGQGLYRVGDDRGLTLINDGMEGGVDGIEPVAGGDFLVSCWGGAIHYVRTDGTRKTLLDTREQKINSADIGYDPTTKTVYVPTFFRHSVVAYQLK